MKRNSQSIDRGCHQANISQLLKEVRKGSNYSNFQSYLKEYNIPTLDFSNKNLKPREIIHILRALRMVEVNPTLILANNPIGANGAKLIAKELKLSKLTSIDFSYTLIGDEGAKIIAKALPFNTETINFAGNCIGDQGAKVIAAEIRIRPVTFVNLSDNWIECSGAKVIDLRVASKVSTLNLSKNFIKDSKDIFGYLPSTIETLDLSFNRLSEIISAKESFKLKVVALKNLNLSNNNINDFGVMTIAKSLMYNDSLRTLDLSHNNISDMGANAFTTVLPKTSLETFNLEKNQIRSRGIQFIEKTLDRNDVATSIKVGDNTFTKKIKTQSNKQELDVVEVLENPKSINFLSILSAMLNNSPALPTILNFFQNNIQTPLFKLNQSNGFNQIIDNNNEKKEQKKQANNNIM